MAPKLGRCLGVTAEGARLCVAPVKGNACGPWPKCPVFQKNLKFHMLCESVVEVEMLATTLHSGKTPCVAGTLYPCVVPCPETTTAGAVSQCLS